MNKRQYDESLVLMRVVLERSGLVLKSLIECLNTEQIQKQKSSNCVGYLKKFFDIGKLYGLFSGITHSTPTILIHFSIRHLFNKNPVKEDSKLSNFDMGFWVIYFYIMEINFSAINFICKDYFKVNSHWTLDDKRKWHYSFQTPNTISGQLFTMLPERV